MPDAIPPALTPEQWAAVRRGWPMDLLRPWEERPAHEVVALANDELPYDDPRKITTADAHACADAAVFGGGNAALARLALKLAALLPPD